MFLCAAEAFRDLVTFSVLFGAFSVTLACETPPSGSPREARSVEMLHSSERAFQTCKTTYKR